MTTFWGVKHATWERGKGEKILVQRDGSELDRFWQKKEDSKKCLKNKSSHDSSMNSLFIFFQSNTCRGALTLIAWERKAIVEHEAKWKSVWCVWAQKKRCEKGIKRCLYAVMYAQREHRVRTLCCLAKAGENFILFLAVASHTTLKQKEFLLITWQIVKCASGNARSPPGWMLKNDRLNDWSENDERWILRDKKFYAQFPTLFRYGGMATKAFCDSYHQGRWFLTCNQLVKFLQVIKPRKFG